MTGEPGNGERSGAPEGRPGAQPPANSADAGALPVSWDLWRRRVYLWTLTLLAPGVLLTWLVWGELAAISVLLGGGLGLFNLQLLGGAVFRMVGSLAAEPDASQPRASPAAAPFRWLGTALATAAILWYMAGQPEGLAAGFTLALLGFVAAATQTSGELSPKPGPNQD